MVAAYDREERRVITTGNVEIDKKIGGGIPEGSLTLIEGQSDAGKSVTSQQFIWGALQAGFHVVVYTTENTVRSLLRQMASLSLDVSDYFLLRQLSIYPVPQNFDQNNGHSAFTMLERHIAVLPRADIVFVDSLTPFVTYAGEQETLAFFSRAKRFCDEDKTLIFTLHSFAFSEPMFIRIRSICDAHLRLRVEEVGTQLIKVLEAAKVRGAERSTGNIITFDVEPGIGMRIVPISKAKA